MKIQWTEERANKVSQKEIHAYKDRKRGVEGGKRFVRENGKQN
jgi:hypothetical protein